MSARSTSRKGPIAETLVSRFFANADRLGSRVMCHYPSGGRFVPLGWRTAGRLVRDFASGLMALGHEQGDTLAIVSNTRWEWVLVDLANLAAGGITVGVYPTLTADQSRYVLAHSEARFVVIEDARQLAKLEASRAGMPRLQTVIVIDPTGITPAAGRHTVAEIIARGREARKDVDERVARLRQEDAAMFVYTSGTTGPPKGAMITHGNVTATLKAFDWVDMGPGDVGFSFLPLAHVLQRTVTYLSVWRGIPGAFARSLDTVADDLGTCRPTLVASVPRIFEKVYAKVNDQASAGGPAKKRIFDWAVDVGRQVSRLRQAREPVPPRLDAQHQIAKALVFDKLRARLGGRIRAFFTGGAPIAKEILEFFDAADITILEGWGMTETFSAGTLNQPGAARFGSIGRPVPGVELKLDTDGEMLIRGPNVFSGYYKDDEATRASFTTDGFFRTGDIARADADGYFYIIDRKKDLIITAAGKNVAPQNIENLLKTDPRISQVVVIGDRRNYLVALVAVTPEVRSANSEDQVRRIVQEVIDARNGELASYERIKKFRVLPAELSQDAGEITPSLKVKRKVVTEKYAAQIEEMYAEAKAQGVATGVGG